jgi:hypothetical protein
MTAAQTVRWQVTGNAGALPGDGDLLIHTDMWRPDDNPPRDTPGK